MKRWRRLKTLRVEIVRPQPGDVLVVSTDKPLTREQFSEARNHLRAFYPNNDTMFMPHGWSLETARSEGAAE